MTAAKSVVCMNEFKYEKYYGNKNVHQEEINKVLIKKRNEEIKRNMIKGYMELLSNFNK